jgi:hypothetical protein
MNNIELERRLARLETQQRWINRVLEAYGIKGLWLSPAKAASLLGVGRDRLISEIERAEYARANRKPSDLHYGTHYRNIQDPKESAKPTWQVHIAEFDKIISLPPDERK